MSELLQESPAVLATQKGTVRRLRHVARYAYSPLVGKPGLSTAKQIENLDAALAKCDEIKAALALAKATIEARQGTSAKTEGAKTALKAVPDKVATSASTTTGFDKADELLAVGAECDWNTSFQRGRGMYHKRLTLMFEGLAGEKVECTYDTKAGVFTGGKITRADGATIKARSAAAVKKVLQDES